VSQIPGLIGRNAIFGKL